MNTTTQELRINRWDGIGWDITVKPFPILFGAVHRKQGASNLERLLECVAEVTGVAVKDILSKRRLAFMIDARFMFVAAAYSRGFSRAKIQFMLGQKGGWRSHMHSIKSHDDRLSIDKNYKAAFERIVERIEG